MVLLDGSDGAAGTGPSRILIDTGEGAAGYVTNLEVSDVSFLTFTRHTHYLSFTRTEHLPLLTLGIVTLLTFVSERLP